MICPEKHENVSAEHGFSVNTAVLSEKNDINLVHCQGTWTKCYMPQGVVTLRCHKVKKCQFVLYTFVVLTGSTN